jgi:hypothetical protein
MLDMIHEGFLNFVIVILILFSLLECNFLYAGVDTPASFTPSQKKMYQVDSVLKVLNIHTVADLNALFAYFLTDPEAAVNVNKKIELIQKSAVVTAVKVWLLMIL